MHDTLGHLLIRIEEIPWGSKLPVNAINDSTIIQHEDALTGERGRNVIRLMEGPGGGVTGPGGSQAGHILANHVTRKGVPRGGAPSRHATNTHIPKDLE